MAKHLRIKPSDKKSDAINNNVWGTERNVY